MAEDPEYDAPVGVGTDDSPIVPEEAPAPEPVEAAPPPKHVDNAVPYDRFREVNERFRARDEEARRYQAELEVTRKQIAALTGATPPAPAVNPEEQAIRSALEGMYPSLKRLNDLPIDKLMEMVDQVPKLQEATAAREQKELATLADTTMSSVWSAGKEMFGGDLSPAQKAMMHRHFVGFLETDPALASRYAARDEHLVAEFLKDFASTVVDPIRRSAAVTVGARAARTAALPTAGPSSGPVGVTTPAAPMSEDARHDAAYEAFRRLKG